jgi:ubiquinone biosynthesis protein COQ4
VDGVKPQAAKGFAGDLPKVAPGVDTRIRPLVALRAMRVLLEDPDDTSQVFQIIRALTGRSFLRLFARVMADPVGREILEARRSLLPVLSDRERLRSLPEGTLGREYARFMDAERITADGLEEASQVVRRVEFVDDRVRCLSDRLRDMHDLGHVVTGYGRDLVGEAALLAFSYAQIRNRGVGFIVAIGYLKFWSEGEREVLPVIRQGWRRGRAASLLPAADWESLLARPLANVRRELRIDPPVVYVALRSQAGEAAAAAAVITSVE